MWPFRLIVVTDRRQSCRDFLPQIERIAAAKPCSLLLREKDLPEAAYEALARQVYAICQQNGVECVLHSFIDVARRIGCRRIHLPLAALRRDRGLLQDFPVIGASVHSGREAAEAQALGASYLTAGHIFPTGCKPGLAPRGLAFLTEVVRTVSIPVYAIGGIDAGNAALAAGAGAQGVCIMSGFMQARDPGNYCRQLRLSLDQPV
ncbi:MAG: thiamine phosphate synthase [Sporomusaceae bacterium]|nr:thiamine phosphate synthase [Sporomusaceae bacterium]